MVGPGPVGPVGDPAASPLLPTWFRPPPDQVDSGPEESLRRSGDPGMGRTLTARQGSGGATGPESDVSVWFTRPPGERSEVVLSPTRSGAEVPVSHPGRSDGDGVVCYRPLPHRRNVPGSASRPGSWGGTRAGPPLHPGWCHLRIGRVGDPDHDPGSRGQDDDLRTRPPSAGRTHHLSTRRGRRAHRSVRGSRRIRRRRTSRAPGDGRGRPSLLGLDPEGFEGEPPGRCATVDGATEPATRYSVGKVSCFT